MESYKQEFIEFMVDCQVLKFGDFVTKSGRKTPFFINTGFTAPARSCASWEDFTPGLSRISSAQTLTCCSGLRIRGSR